MQHHQLGHIYVTFNPLVSISLFHTPNFLTASSSDDDDNIQRPLNYNLEGLSETGIIHKSNLLIEWKKLKQETALNTCRV